MISNTELARHIYKYILKTHGLKENDPMMLDLERDTVNYVANLIHLNTESDNHLGSKGFVCISKEKDIREGFGC